MNASHCSFLLFSLHPLVRDNYAERKFVILSTTITAILTGFGIFANGFFIIVMLREHIRRPRSQRLNSNLNSGNMARKKINKNRSSNQVPKLLMISLAFNDFIYSCFVSPVAVSENMENGVWKFGQTACYARILLIYYQFSVTMFHINSMAIDRYIAVCRPFVYRLLTNKSGYLLIGFSWGLPAIMQLVPHVLGWAHVEDNKIFKCTGKECADIYHTISFIVLMVVGFCIPFFTPYCFYVCILKEVIMFNRRRPEFRGKIFKKNTKTVSQSTETGQSEYKTMENEIQDKSSMVTNAAVRSPKDIAVNVENKTGKAQTDFHCNNNVVPSPVKGSHRKNTSSKYGKTEIFDVSSMNFALRAEKHIDASNQSTGTPQINRNVKAYRTVGAIILCFSLCWCPVWIILSQFLNARDPIPSWFHVLTNALSNMNPALNPLLYCLNRSVREAIKSFLVRS